MNYSIFIFLLFVGSSFDLSVDEKYPERKIAQETIDVLMASRRFFPKVVVYLDNIDDFPSQNFIRWAVALILKNPELLDKYSYKKFITDVDNSLRHRIIQKLHFVSNISEDIDFEWYDETKVSNYTGMRLLISGFVFKFGFNGIHVTDNINSAIIFGPPDKISDRYRTIMHEYLHAFFGGTHNSNGRVVSPTPYDPLDSQHSIIMYKDITPFSAPGSLSPHNLTYLGELDWSLIQNLTRVKNPYGKLLKIYVKGTHGIRGSPGPISWFSTVIVGPSSHKRDFFAEWIENLKILSDLYEHEGIVRYTLGLILFALPEEQKLWHKLWDWDTSTISLVPGRFLFRYRSDYLRGPSFNPHEEDSPLKVIVRRIPYVDIHLYGNDRTLELHHVNKAFIKIGPEINGIIRGFNIKTDIISLVNSSRIIPRVMCKEFNNNIYLHFLSKGNKKNLSSTLYILNVGRSGCQKLFLCGGENGILGNCSSSKKRTISTSVKIYISMVLPCLFYIAFLECFGICLRYCLCFLWPCRPICAFPLAFFYLIGRYIKRNIVNERYTAGDLEDSQEI